MEIKLTKPRLVPHLYEIPNGKRALLLMMRTVIILFCTSVFSLASVNLASQNTKIKIDEDKTVTVDEVFQIIKSQTKEYMFIYPEDLFKGLPMVQLKKGVIHMDKLINQSIASSNLNIVLAANNTILIKEAKSVQQIRVSGKVTDEKGMPVAGATVLIKGTARGTATDFDGSYAITVTDPANVLVFSALGFATQEITVGNQANINVILKEQASELEEVILNAGYYKTTEKKKTGSISKVSAIEIEKQPVSDPLQSLQGRVPGLIIKQINGVVAGGAFDVQIRGTNSIAAGNNPLYIVDGVPYPSTSLVPGGFGNQLGFNLTSPFNGINPSDIESIDVLKDADATAIYGSRGANGVVLITTKRGKVGKSRLDVNIYGGIGQINQRLDLLSLDEYLAFRREAFANAGITPTAANAPDLELWSQTEGIDFQDMLMGETANILDANISFNGGNEQTQYVISGNYRKQGSVTPGDDLGLSKVTTRMALDHKLFNDKLTLNATMLFGADKNIFLPDNFVYQFYLAPNYPLYDDNGDLYFYDGFANNANNPAGTLLERSQNFSQNFTGNFGAVLTLAKGLEFKNNFGYTHLQTEQNILNPSSSQNPASISAGGSASFGNGSIKTIVVEPQLNYNLTLGNAKISALAGATYQYSKSVQTSITGRNFLSDDLIEDINAAGTVDVGINSIIEYKYASVFSRLGLDWADKYLLNLTYRRDASSRFGDDNKVGDFGAVGAAWIFSEETFLKDNTVLSFGKLRASYGTTGNDQIQDYGYLPSYGSARNYIGPALSPLRIANPLYSWETNKKLEFGLELGFLKDRFRLITNYFKNRSGDQLVGVPLPAQSGFSSYQANLPAEVENTGWEFDVTANIINKGKFLWTANLNLTAPKNKLVSFPGIENTSYANTFEVGKPLASVFGYNFLNFDQNTGLAVFEDVDGDDNVSYPNDLTYLGKRYPDVYGGLNNEFSFGNFRVNFLLQFSKGNKEQGPSIYGAVPGTLGNQVSDVLNYWQSPGDNASYPYITAETTGDTWLSSANYNYYTFGLSDASFIRLTNLYCSYDLDSNIVKNMGLRALSVYVSGQNLFTITNYNGLDPETGGTFMPPLTVWSLGLKVSL